MNNSSIAQILEVAKQAAEEAGAYILESSRRTHQLEVLQKSPRDYVSEVDRNSETIIRQLVEEHFPQHAFLGEEYGGTSLQLHENESKDELEASIDCQHIWIVDPLDGTTNFLRGIAHYAVSIAVMRAGRLLVAVVFDPAKNEMFTATQGGGAFLNNHQIACSSAKVFDGSLLATGVPFSGECLAELPEFQQTVKQLLDKKSSGIRRLGAAALDLAYVAAGRYDGYWEAKLKPWDIAAGMLLVNEANGVVGNFNGAQDIFGQGDIVAANAVIFEEIVGVTSQTYVR